MPTPTALLDPATYLARFEAAAPRAGFRLERFGEIADYPLLAASRRTPGPRPRIYLSAGIHGDEPAPPFALLAALEQGVFDARAVWIMCPLLNPLGFTRRTRENAEGVDLNRDYRAFRTAEIQAHARWLRAQPNFDLAICVHEDWESNGFYLYELNATGTPGFAREIVDAVAACCPIDPATVIDGRPISAPGIIRPDGDPFERDLWPEAFYLRAHHTQLSYTFETPSSFPLDQRVNALVTAIRTAIDQLLGAPADTRPAAD
ncbi:M14 family metallocarboxypeptidase [Opitutus sp. ER46]|uniref:M14 family metallopeptidase n=1 Tax=Opitutus sp. ER46 TaxID=2161864 RepID=UPI000D30ACA5|nr:M14 family metallocarboxypeptidase [Opitutus sp. ER46]PTY00323.1 succinylglutamate desuccinylase [Opitutus sp. ER46]